ncbi:XdhC family protein [Bacillus sp. S3]|uniref:XdhC family protein n=1 Tax=Bacillus sp. S3 TaxID=486398 RepID=UPI00118AFD5C|nr:XdhC/CoxI family protein [Bacillus sp. S3]QCJ41209.1 XdhC family protein [Bacillus sp. S3]
MQAIFNEIIRCKSHGLEGVLGTIISTKGSTYQKTGAKCFIAGDGQLTGLVSGGCVEGDLKEIAFEVIESGQPRIVHYNFQDEGDLLWGLGLGCNGKMNILLEPYSPIRDLSKSVQMENWFKEGLSKTIHSITITGAENPDLVGSKWIVDPETREYDHIPYKEIIDDYLRTMGTGTTCSLVQIEGSNGFQVFYDTITPSPRMAIFGAGPDAVPLAQMAKKIKWHVTVLDHRPAFVNQTNFPEADELICYKPGTTPQVRFDENTYVVIMSHHFSQDQIILKEVLDSDAAYIGLLGPRKRTYQLCEGMDLNNHPNLYKIHSPIGLNIGSVTPEEIALSIMAEISMIYRGGTGNKLSKGALQFPYKEDEQLSRV